MDQSLIDSRLDLPIWLEPPHWTSGLTETLEWQTWVGVSESMAEQRVAQRRFPRRYWDVPFRGFYFRQSLLQNMMVAVGRDKILLPLFPFRVLLTEPAPVDSLQLLGDFRYKQFKTDELLVIRDPFDFYRYEVALVTSATDAQVSVATGLQYSWSPDAEIYPLRVCRIEDDPRGTLRSDQVMDVNVRFMQTTIERQPVSITYWERHPLDNEPIMPMENNWRDNPTFQTDRDVGKIDNMQSQPHYYDVGGQSNITMIWRRTTFGREELDEMRSILYYLCGQQNVVWLKSLTDDIEVVEQVVPAAGEIFIRRIGLEQFRAARQEVRKDIVFEMVDGEVIYGRLVSARTDGGIERIVLADNLEVAYKPSDFYRISFLVKARLSADRIDIQHQTDADGVQEIALPFKLFYNRRDV